MALSIQDLGFVPIDNKVVLLTGASSGMGRSAALLLAKGGAKLALMARRKEKLDSLSAEITAAGAAAPLTLTGDVRSETDCETAVKSTLEKYGKIDVLVNNAGVGFPSNLETESTEQYKTMIETNVDGVFFMTRAVLPVMKKQKTGDIIMISSPAGESSNPVAPIYCASKFALEGYLNGLRMQLNQLHGEGIHIRVVDILPGCTNSEYWGDRKVPREKFMTNDEMGCIIVQAISTAPKVLVKQYEVEEFRFAE